MPNMLLPARSAPRIVRPALGAVWRHRLAARERAAFRRRPRRRMRIDSSDDPERAGLSFPPQRMKRTTCQSRNHAAGTAGSHGKHRARENRAKNVTASIRRTGGTRERSRREASRWTMRCRRRGVARDSRGAPRPRAIATGMCRAAAGAPGHQRKMILTCNAVLTAGGLRSSEAPALRHAIGVDARRGLPPPLALPVKPRSAPPFRQAPRRRYRAR